MNSTSSPRPGCPLVLSYKGPSPDEEILTWIAAGLVGGVVLFKDNCADLEALRVSIAEIRRGSPQPLSIMIDEEGGRVRRLPDGPDSMPDLRDYGSYAVVETAAAYGRVARRLRSLEIDTLLAPVVDLGEPGADWLRSRTFADEPQEVASMAAAVIPAVQSEGVHACAKHFPGTGRVQLDPHYGPVICNVTPDDWKTRELIPFSAAIAAGVDMIMVGHQVMRGFGDHLPACLSRDIVEGRLRQELGYPGLILTDDLSMGAIAGQYSIEHAVTSAIGSGCDLVLVCNDRVMQRRAVELWKERIGA